MNSPKKKTIVFVGGHITTALAVIDTARQITKDVEIVVFGRKSSTRDEKGNSFEVREVTARKLQHVSIPALRGVWGVFGFVPSFLYCLLRLFILRPFAVLGFGGYLSVPVGFAAFVLAIPFYIHEQTMKPGHANRLLSFIARKTLLGFEESSSYLKKPVFVGNPIRPSFFHTSAISWVKKPSILVLGGSMGSKSINAHIFALLPTLVPHVTVIHQTGGVGTPSDYDQALKLKADLDDGYREKYIPFQHISSQEVGSIMKSVDIIISRAGANTVAEILFLKKPSILIPLPWSSQGEQQIHASQMRKWGVSLEFDQTKPSELLLRMVLEMLHNVNVYEKAFETIPQKQGVRYKDPSHAILSECGIIS